MEKGEILGTLFALIVGVALIGFSLFHLWYRT